MAQEATPKNRSTVQTPLEMSLVRVLEELKSTANVFLFAKQNGDIDFRSMMDASARIGTIDAEIKAVESGLRQLRRIRPTASQEIVIATERAVWDTLVCHHEPSLLGTRIIIAAQRFGFTPVSKGPG